MKKEIIRAVKRIEKLQNIECVILPTTNNENIKKMKNEGHN